MIWLAYCIVPMPIDLVKLFLDLIDKTNKGASSNGAFHEPLATTQTLSP